MANQNNIQKAINLLAVAQDNEMRWTIETNIENQNDLNNINVEDSKSFSFSWSDVETKADELDAEDVAKIDAKASGNTKLLDLGLTQAEATALTGYTPE